MLNKQWICENCCYSSRHRGSNAATARRRVADISAKVHIPALRAYRIAVGRRTREIVRNLQPTEAEERVDATNIEVLVSAGALAEGAYSLAEYWNGKRKTALLAMPATRHSLTHLNQALLVRKKLGLDFE